MEKTNDFGEQPLATLMQLWRIDAHAMVRASTEQLTYKQVNKAVQGRKLTLPMRQKVSRAFNVAIWYTLEDEQKELFVEYFPKHLFNYQKNYISDTTMNSHLLPSTNNENPN